MARYFDAPVVQPIDYGFQMPFQEIMYTLGNKQKAQDESVAAGMAMYKEQKDAIDTDNPLRNAYRQMRTSRLDKLMYDEEGNLKDLSGASGLIQKEANTRANEEMTGGLGWALSASLTSLTDYNKQLDDLHKDEKITKDHYNWLKTNSKAIYDAKGGLGAPSGPDGYSSDQLFQGTQAANYQDLVEKGETLAKGTGALQVQSSGMQYQVDPETGMYIIQEDAGDFKGVDGGRYRQTGTVLQVPYNKIATAVGHGLIQDQKLIEYLRQEAQFSGGAQTAKEVNEYVQKKIEAEAHRSAMKYMEAKFEPKLMEDWKAKEYIKFQYGKSLIKLEQLNANQVVELPTVSRDSVEKLVPGKFQEGVKLANDAVTEATNALAKFQATLQSRPLASQWTPEEQAQYRKLVGHKRQAEVALDNMNTKFNKVIGKLGYEDGNDMMLTLAQEGLRKMPATILRNLGVDPQSEMGREINNRSGEVIGWVINGENGNIGNYDTTKEALDAAIAADTTGEVAARLNEVMNGNIKAIPLFDEIVNKYANQGDSYANSTAKWNKTDEMKLNPYLTPQYQYDKIVTKGIDEINKEGGIAYTTNYTVVSTVDGNGNSLLTEGNKAVFGMLETNNFEGVYVSDGAYKGQNFDPKLLVKDNEEIVPKSGKMEMVKGNENTPGQGGVSHRQLSYKVKLSDGTIITRSQIVAFKPEVHHTTDELQIDQGLDIINKAIDNLGEAVANRNISTGMRIVGETNPMWRESYNQGLGRLAPGETKTFTYQGEPSMTVTRLSNAAGGGYTVKDADGNTLTDNRISVHADGSAVVFGTLDDITEAIGQATYQSSLNTRSTDNIRGSYAGQGTGTTKFSFTQSTN